MHGMLLRGVLTMWPPRFGQDGSFDSFDRFESMADPQSSGRANAWPRVAMDVAIRLQVERSAHLNDGQIQMPSAMRVVIMLNPLPATGARLG